MGSEVLEVGLPAGSVCGEFFQGNSTLFDDEFRLVAVGDEHGLNDGLFLPPRGHGHKQRFDDQAADECAGDPDQRRDDKASGIVSGK